MIIVIQPFHLIIFALAGWLNRQQQAVIDYLMEENRVLKEQLEGQRLRFTGQQRIRLAVKAEVVGRRTLYGLEKLLTPDTLLGWHRKLIEVDLCPEGTGSALRCAGDRRFGSPHGERECLLRLRSNPRRASGASVGSSTVLLVQRIYQLCEPEVLTNTDGVCGTQLNILQVKTSGSAGGGCRSIRAISQFIYVCSAGFMSAFMAVYIAVYLCRVKCHAGGDRPRSAKSKSTDGSQCHQKFSNIMTAWVANMMKNEERPRFRQVAQSAAQDAATQWRRPEGVRSVATNQSLPLRQ